MLVSTAFAGAIGEGRVSAVTFATRIHEFVLGVFAVSVATVMLPTLSKLIADNKKDEAVENLGYSLRLVALVTIPATFGFVVLGREIVRMIFEYGAFSSKSTYLVSSALRYLSISLFFVASYRILVQSFYAMKDMKTPVYIAFFTFIINAVSNYLCVYVFKFDIIFVAFAICSPLFSSGVQDKKRLQKRRFPHSGQAPPLLFCRPHPDPAFLPTPCAYASSRQALHSFQAITPNRGDISCPKKVP